MVGREPHFFESPSFLARCAGRLNKQRIEPGEICRKQMLWRRVKVGDEFLGQFFDGLSSINEMWFRPMCIDGPKRVRQVLNQAGMAKGLAPNKALGQEGSLQQGRAGSPASGEHKNGLFAAIASCVGPSFEDGSHPVGDRVLWIKII